MSTIYLVRHGITPANRENRFAGRTGEGLHADGIEQIRQVGEKLCHENIKAVFCGPAKRTLQSAEILGSLLGVPFSALPELDEIDIPHWDGLTKEEIRQQYDDQYPTWLAAPQDFYVPGCETLQQVQNRALNGVNRIVREEQEYNHLLVSHLIVLRCLVLHYQGLGIREFRSIKIDNGSVLKISNDEQDGLTVNFI